MCFIHLEWATSLSVILTVELSVSFLHANALIIIITHNSIAMTRLIVFNKILHSIFYAPQYVSIELGYFEDESIDLNLVTGFGADKVMTALVSKEADIGFMGSESSIYVYQEGSTDYAVNFAQLTQRAGNFLVSRDNETDFKWDNLKGRTVLGGRAGGMPQMLFEYILKKNGISPVDDLTILQNVDFGSTAAAFTSGIADYTVEFEPSATLLEQQKEGYVVASLGTDSGYVPYTAYCANKSFIEKHPDESKALLTLSRKALTTSIPTPAVKSQKLSLHSFLKPTLIL